MLSGSRIGLGILIGTALLMPLGCKKNIPKTNVDKPKIKYMENSVIIEGLTGKAPIINENGSLAKDEEGNALEKEVSLADFEGKVKLLVQSRGRCGYCYEESIWLESFYKERKDQDFEVIEMLNYDMDYEPATVEFAYWWSEQFNTSYMVLADTEDFLGKFNSKKAVPMNIVLDKKNKMVAKSWGFDSEWIKYYVDMTLYAY